MTRPNTNHTCSLIFSMTVFLALCLSLPNCASASDIYDNSDPQFSIQGLWSSSTNTAGYYGIDYQHSPAGDGSAKASWNVNLAADGTYEIYARWTANYNRATNAPYAITSNGITIDTVLADQSVHGGQFMLLGTYALAAGPLEVVLSNNASNYVIADAIEIINLGEAGNIPPEGTIDSPSSDIVISPGDSVDFSGSGFDIDGNYPLSFHWDFGGGPIPADPDAAAPGTLQFNDIGTFHVTLTVTDAAGSSDPTPAEVIVRVSSGEQTLIDNTDPLFSAQGPWNESTYTAGYYGSSYHAAPKGDGSMTATWSFNIPDNGTHEIYAQWTAGSNRAPDAPYSIYNNGSFIGTALADQGTDGGQFMLLGAYPLAAGTLEVVLSNTPSGYVIADAIEIVNLGTVANIPPDGTIDTPSSNIIVNVGDLVDFSGSGTDPDSSSPVSYHWDFGGGAFPANPNIASPGPVQFATSGTFLVTLTVSDTLNLADPSPAEVIVHVSSGSKTLVDNTDPQFTTQGAWPESTYTSGYYGANYQSAAKGDGSMSASWFFNIASTGQYDVSAQWTASSNRATDAPYTIYNNGIEIETVLVDQSVQGGDFRLLGTYPLAAGTLEVVLRSTASGYVIADAAQISYQGAPDNMPPQGTIDLPSTDLSINVGDTVSFSGSGIDMDGDQPLSFEWNFGDPLIAPSHAAVPGAIQFNNAGIYTVSLNVIDAKGLADPTPAIVTVQVASEFDSIRDNTDPQFSIMGSWPSSSNTKGFYGSTYQYAPPGDGYKSATWHFDISTPGNYEISAQWTSYWNRTRYAPYSIYNNGELIDMVEANQTTKGGQFNRLGTYLLYSGSLDIVLNDDPNGYVIADATQIVYVDTPANMPPRGIIATPSAVVKISPGGQVNFAGSGSDVDGDNALLTYHWNFGDPSIPSVETKEPGLVQFNNTGVYTVSLTVTDSQGLSDPTPQEVTVYVSTYTIKDNLSPDFTVQGSWEIATKRAGFYGENYQYPPWGPKDTSGTWSFEVSTFGNYEILAHWPAYSTHAWDAPYTIYNNGIKLGEILANQRYNGGQFNSLGTFFLAPGTLEIEISNSLTGYVIADAVSVTKLNDAPPMVQIISPTHKQLTTLPDIAVAAQLYNLPANWTINFVLDGNSGNPIIGTPCGTAPGYICADIIGPLSQDEHTLKAYALDNKGVKQNFSDQIIFGVGDYYVLIGGGITAGVGDDDMTDNISADGRNLHGGRRSTGHPIVSGGFGQILNDLLTESLDYPHTVINEGLGSSSASTYLLFLRTVIERHPEAQRYLILFGTSDAAAYYPSGLGLSLGDPGYSGSYKHSMQRIIDIILEAGKQPCLTHVPISLGAASAGTKYPDPSIEPRNLLIQDYNLVVDELIAENGLSTSPPDLYNHFEMNQGELYDNYHPNGQGHRSIAEMWHDVLVP